MQKFDYTIKTKMPHSRSSRRRSQSRPLRRVSRCPPGTHRMHLRSPCRRYSTKKGQKQPRSEIVKSTKHYQNRPSPPIPANQHCGEKRLGNNKKIWTSRPNVLGICSWRPH